MDNDLIKDVFADLMSAAPTSQPPVEGAAPSDGLDKNLITGQDEPPATNTSTGTDAGKANVPDAALKDSTPNEPASDSVSWDSFIDDTPTEPTPAKSDFNWSEIGKAIGITSEVKAQEDVASYIKELQKAAESAKSNPLLDENTPKEFVEALEIHKNGGDFVSYLTLASEDYSSIDPIELFEDEVAELFYNEDGSFREDEYYDYLDSIKDTDKKIRGIQIQRELISMQEQTKREMQQRVAYEKQENLKNLEKSIESFQKVGNFEVTPKVKKQMFDELASGKFLDAMGISMNGKHNWNKLLDNYFKARYFDAVQKFNETSAINKTKRDILNGTTNSTVARQGDIANPTSPAPKLQGVDLYLQQVSQAKK